MKAKRAKNQELISQKSPQQLLITPHRCGRRSTQHIPRRLLHSGTPVVIVVLCVESLKKMPMSFNYAVLALKAKKLGARAVTLRLCRAIFHPTRAGARAQAGCRTNVGKIFLLYGSEAKVCHVSTGNRARLAIDDIYFAVWRLEGQPTGTHDAEFEVGARATSSKKCLLRVLILENVRHDGLHQNFECPWSLTLAVTAANGCNHGNSLHTVLLACVDDALRAIRQHRRTHVLRLSTQRYNDPLHILAFKNFIHISLIRDLQLSEMEEQ